MNTIEKHFQEYLDNFRPNNIFDEGKHLWELKDWLRSALLQVREETIRDGLRAMPADYEEPHLGETDIPPSEMFNRGFNSATTQSRIALVRLLPGMEHANSDHVSRAAIEKLLTS